MADKQDRWLDRETAERLLRGESPGHGLEGPAEEQAERLARTLAALSAPAAEPLPADEELPGEAAALAAFRKTHADRADLARGATAGLAGEAGGAGEAHAVDVGLVRIVGGVREAGRRPRRIRPARLGLAAALAVGVLGGVAVGTGVLPSPFDGAEPAHPSVSAPALPERPLVPPSPDASGGAAPSTTPEGGTGGPGGTGGAAGKGAGNGTADDDATAGPDLRGVWPGGVTSSCRDLSTGKTLDAGRRRTLENLAGGSKRVPTFCAGVLDHAAGGNPRGDARTGSGTAGRDTGQGQRDRDGLSGSTRGSGTDDTSGRGGGTSDDDDGGHRGGRRGHDHGGGSHGGSHGGGRHGHGHG
ncbi:hypothetical protein [Streptomyces soliscabiei]|uniref:hypothetical protein n=1 Tax=Streptomyces soliscabiei TaxID=588897 RepID=UPI0029BE9F27|nr:hypothetical protein [Streptomyces sp. NY05-11A]MDX2675563.1 hypothetical protein [Streptomyces sp. NY05-11A]